MRKRFLIIRLAISGMLLSALAPAMKSVTPPPDGGYPGGNTAEGDHALFSWTTGTGRNTAVGYHAINNLPAGSGITAVGAFSLATTTDLFNSNVAIGFQTLLNDDTGYNNAAVGNNALLNLSTNSFAFDNGAVGANALSANINGTSCSAVGSGAMKNNGKVVGHDVAFGYNALRDVNGGSNVAVGSRALVTGDGHHNVALGSRAMSHLSGSHSNNVAIGFAAGSQLGSSGDENIDVGNVGAPGDSGVIRIGTTGVQNAAFISGISGVTIAQSIGVVVDADGHLGNTTSSARVKERVRPMAEASEILYSLQPVAFHYRPELDPSHVPQFGLIAEEVAEVAPALVACDRQGRPYAVRYQAINAMLLNEFQKDYRTEILEEATVKAHTDKLDQLADKVANVELELAQHAKALKNFEARTN